MPATPLTGTQDCDDVLNWLEVHSLSLRQGLPTQVLQNRWAQAGRSPESLDAALQLLSQGGWIMPTPGLHPPHLRFTSDGFSRLLDAAPATDDTATVAPSAEASIFATEPAAEPEAAPAEPEPEAAPEPPRTVVFDQTESQLRNDILTVYRELRLKAESRLIGVTLSRYWQESGHRAGDLRTGIDVLLRDGYLERRLVGIDLHWMLTHDGEFFINGPLTPLRLMSLAPRIDKIARAPAAGELRRLATRAVLDSGARAGSVIDYEKLRPDWIASSRHDENALLHGLDLMFKSGFLAVGPGLAATITLTAKGEEAGNASGSGLFSKLARALR